jgi:hypothetical protein
VSFSANEERESRRAGLVQPYRRHSPFSGAATAVTTTSSFLSMIFLSYSMICTERSTRAKRYGSGTAADPKGRWRYVTGSRRSQGLSGLRLSLSRSSLIRHAARRLVERNSALP